MAKTKAQDAKVASNEVVTPEVIQDAPAVQPENSSGIIKLSPFEQKVAEYKPFLELKIKDHSDKKGFETVEEARKKVKASKVEAKKVTDEVARPFKEILDQINAKGGKVFKDLKEIEDNLDAKSKEYKGWVEAEEARIKKEQEEKIERRFDQVVSLGATFNGFSSYKIGELSISQVEMRSMSDEEFIDFTTKAEAESSRVRLEKAAEEERLAKEKEAQEAATKAEAERIAAENARIQKQQEELAAAQEALKKQQEELAEQQRKAKEEANAAAAQKKKEEEEAAAAKQKAAEELAAAQLKMQTNLRISELKAAGARQEGNVFWYKDLQVMEISDVEDAMAEEWAEIIESIPNTFKEHDEAILEEERLKKEQEEADAKAETDRLAKEAEAQKVREEEEKAAEEALKPDKEKLLGIVKKARDLCAKVTMTSPGGEYLMEELLTSLNEHESIIQTYKL